MQPIKAPLVSPRAMPMRIGSPILMRNNVPRRGSRSRHILLSQKAEGGCPSLPFGGVGQSPLACASFMLRGSADGGEGTMTLLATPRSAGRRPGTRYSLELPVRLLGRGRSFVESDACRSLASRSVGLACSTSTRRGGARVESVDDDDPLQRCAGRFGAKGGNQYHAKQRTNFCKHFLLLFGW